MNPNETIVPRSAPPPEPPPRPETLEELHARYTSLCDAEEAVPIPGEDDQPERVAELRAQADAAHEAVISMEEELLQKIDKAAFVLGILKARIDGATSEARSYEQFAAPFRARAKAAEARRDRLCATLLRIIDDRGGDPIEGETFIVAAKLGAPIVVPVDRDGPEPAVPPAAQKIVIDRRALARLAQAGKAPGWTLEQSRSIRIAPR